VGIHERADKGRLSLEELVLCLDGREHGTHQVLEDQAFIRLYRGYLSVSHEEMVSSFDFIIRSSDGGFFLKNSKLVLHSAVPDSYAASIIVSQEFDSMHDLADQIHRQDQIGNPVY